MPVNSSNNPRNDVYGKAQFALELGYRPIGTVISTEGADLKFATMQMPSGGMHVAHAGVGKPQYADIRLSVGMAMARDFYDWMSGFFEGKPVRKSGALVTGDAGFSERARREFTDALISEVVFPALGGRSEPALMEVALAPETVQFSPGRGQSLPHAENDTDQRKWAMHRFRFTVDGLDSACKRASRIERLAIKQQIVEHHGGTALAARRLPSRVSYPNIVVTLPEADAQRIYDHAQRQARAGGAQRLTGSVEYLRDGTGDSRPLATLRFEGAHLIAVTGDKQDVKGDGIKQVRCEFSVESMRFARG